MEVSCVRIQSWSWPAAEPTGKPPAIRWTRTTVKELKEGGLDSSGVIALLAARPVMLTLVEQPPD